MKITLVTKEEHTQLLEIFTNYPNLTVQNIGYDFHRKSPLTDEEKDKIKEVETLLRKNIFGFNSFKNFRTNNKTQEIQLRFDYNYNYDNNGIPFNGVGYLYLHELLNGFRN
jgi:ABC-type uncharacterized transport system substrate-binding protein